MRQSLFWVAAVALAAALPAGQIAAQESADISAEAAADTGQANVEASADAGTSDAQQTDAQADAKTSTSGDVNAGQSTSAEVDTQREAAARTDRGASQAGSDTQSVPPPRQDAGAPADAEGQQQATQRQPGDSAQDDAPARSEAAADADASAQDRARGDTRTRRGGHDDAGRGIQFGRATDRGVTINHIERNSIYFDSGLRRGDIIVSFGGRPIRSEAEFYRFVTRHRGERVPIIVLRDGRRETIYVEHSADYVADVPHDGQRLEAGGHAYLGVHFDPQIRDAAVVRSVMPGSPAEQAGLRPNDVILALNRQSVRSYRDAIDIIRSMRPGDRLSIVVESETEAVLASQPGGSMRTATRAREYRVEQQDVVETRPQQDTIEVERRDRAMRRPLRDRDADGERDRSLLQRLID